MFPAHGKSTPNPIKYGKLIWKRHNFRSRFCLVQMKLLKLVRFKIQIGKIYSGQYLARDKLIIRAPGVNFENKVRYKIIFSVNQRLYQGWENCDAVQIKTHKQIEVETATTNGVIICSSGNGSVMIWLNWEVNVEPDDVFSIGR